MEWSSSRVNSLNRSSTSSRTMGSSPAVASSSTSSFGWWLNATAIASFIRMPREKSLNCFFNGRSNRFR